MRIDVVPELSDGALVDRIVSGDYIVSFDALGHRRRKRRRVFIGAVVGLAASGGIAVAALNRQSEPKYPEAGIMCRAEFDLDANGEARPAGADPIGACAQVWRAGRPGADPSASPGGSVPDLVVCVGRGGALEVYPVTGAQACADLGLADAIVPPAPDAVVRLEGELAGRVNAKCLSRTTARQEIGKIIDALRLSDWRIVESVGDGPCFRGVAVRDERVVRIVPGPDFGS